MKNLVLALFVAMLLLPLSAKAVQNLKLAVVDVQEVIDGVEEGKNVKMNLEKEKLDKQNILEEKKREVTKLGEEMEKQRLILSQEALLEKQRKLDEKMRGLQQAYMEANDDMNRKYNDALVKIYTRIESVVAKIAKDNGYNMVLHKGMERGVIYSQDTFNVTKKVIDIYNSTYPDTQKGAKKK